MSSKVFVAGGTGVIGRQLVPMLKAAGYEVFAATRSQERMAALEHAGAHPVLLDVFDAANVERSFMEIRPDILIHQLSDLPWNLDPAAMPEAVVRNARVRIVGTPNLMNAARAAGTRRAIAQSIVWLYAAGPQPHTEDDPLGVTDDSARVTLDGVVALENAVLGTPPVEGIVLRYGQFYGPGTIKQEAQGMFPVHVQAAAQAAVLAIEKGRPGIYNIADDNAFASTAKAREELGWDPGYRR